MTANDNRAGAADLADLASEFWKLIRNYDQLIDVAPEKLRPGLVAQANYGARRLTAILAQAGMHLETFDGMRYTANLPIVAVNSDDFADETNAVIEQTLEPAIIVGTTPIKTGRVYLGADKTQES